MEGPLFRKCNMYQVQLDREKRAKEAVAALPNERLKDSDEPLVEEIAANLAITVPTLDLSGIYQTDQQVKLDARRLPNRVVLDPYRPVPVDGTEVSIHIPYTGDPFMFDVCPSHHTLNPPVGEIDLVKSEVVLVYRTADENFPIRARYEGTVQQIQQHLESLRQEAAQVDGIKQSARTELTKRRQAAASHSKIVDSLGIPRRTA